MRIILPIKQVPETTGVRMDERTGTMIREGVEAIVNPLDLYAIEAALRLREARGGEVIALSMGPPTAAKALREALAMGADSAVLLSDKAFAGSDTWATSYTLAAAIRRLAPYDLVVCGERATDGDTGQVGPGLHLDRMNRILEIDRENMTVTCEPGVVTNDINDRVKADGLFYAGYPMSVETCFIGGNVAENAGGGKAVKYGVTGRYVVGLEVVTPQGEIVNLGGKLAKDVTGYNLIQLMVGSEGTLGIFTKVILRLMPLPKAKVDLLVLFRTTEEAIAAVPRIMTAGGIIPTAIEFMDQLSVRTSCEYLNESIPYEQAGAMLLISVDGPSAEQVDREYEAIGDLCLGAGAIEVYVADNATTAERIWKVRRNVAEAFFAVSPLQCLEDLVVPIAAIPRMVVGAQEISRKHDCPIPCYGHAGDGNIHATVIMNPAWTLQRWHETLPDVLADLYRLAAGLGGTLSGEHGIGHKRKEFMPLFVSEAHLNLLRAIKRALDPNLILNPGKIFDL